MASVVVVGAGVTGLVTAVDCTLAGHRVTVLDRGPLPNPASTSADHSRALRVLRPGDVPATLRMARARRRWLALEGVLRTRVFRPVGVVTACAPDELDAALGTARDTGVPAVVVRQAAVPPVLLPAGTRGVLDRHAGVLLAERFLRAATAWLAERPGVALWPGRTVVDVAEQQVTLADGTKVGADVVVVAAGPWTADLLGTPVRLHRQTTAYLRPPPRLADWWGSAPGVGRIGADGRAWLLPPGDGALLKISSDAVCREVGSTDEADDGPWTRRLLAEPVLADLADYRVVAVRDCHYAADPDTGGPVLTRVRPSVWSRPACGGSGFGTAPLVADEIAAAVMEVSA
ncbi:FAD-dependent oxidoreductase [Saccharothrix variisporea]|uniref:Glycine/D-amino acid oxidase-like deaminating enzyme n=1 Tax=Saccharothrix variisporea TaxID=543527 RepID=A0A495XJN6_9PSEU|nr:FAD-dependent oxidoreductase [Saccharothrix variisporea]RKT74630.1 glycine/D-amino acid oxidase-like deaminating enzyme [Saccharothrix variisporea]